MSESLQGRRTTLFLLMGEFFGFSHTGATRCTNQAEIWQRSDSKKLEGAVMARRSSIILQNLMEIERRTSA